MQTRMLNMVVAGSALLVLVSFFSLPWMEAKMTSDISVFEIINCIQQAPKGQLSGSDMATEDGIIVFEDIGTMYCHHFRPAESLR